MRLVTWGMHADALEDVAQVFEAINAEASTVGDS
jgi:hypothetical protein